MEELVAQVSARLHPIEEVMDRLQIGRSKLYELMDTGQIRSCKVGRRRLVSEAALCEFIASIDRVA
ncbi:ethanolamine utilization protein EutA [Mycobacteroides chelonae]|uniref:Ethanolamine utilization protein EutA n=1 Tax=Mycobacteroides chelonae TaxID=1774 RepID=A0A1S1LRE1_MYCCH|nr:helix-turn-helix domain-containing protein [Mycobacteroides chelonae]OHU60346.1 ethanolamine utilization protein EutA [Mycobacteroides chelonae]